MVDVTIVRDAAYRITKVGTSGYDSTTEFIAKANEVNLDLMNLLTPHYGKQVEAVDDILSTFVKTTAVTFTSGVFAKPADFYGYISVVPDSGVGIVRKIKTNQIGALGRNSIRKATTAAPQVYLNANGFNILPNTITTGNNLMYFRLPADIDIVTQPYSNPDDDYEIVTNQTDFEWDPRAKNLLIYLLVERLGGEMKQPILVELAKLGIQMNLNVEPVQ